MSRVEDIKIRRQINPLISLAVIVVFSCLVTLFSFSIFWRSNTKNIVQSIQRANQNFNGTQIVATGLDDDGRLSTSELLFIQENLEAETAKLQPELDFGGNELGKASIGF